MFSDLDFLDKIDELNFGYPMSGNPLCFPYFGDIELPTHTRLTSISTMQSKSGFVSKQKPLTDDCFVDGIEVTRLKYFDQYIREEVNANMLKNGSGNHQQYNQSLLAVGENGMNDSYVSSNNIPRGSSLPAVNFRDNYNESTNIPNQSMTFGESSIHKGLQHSTSAQDTRDHKNIGRDLYESSQKSTGINLTTTISPPKKSKRSSANSKWIAKTKQIRLFSLFIMDSLI